MLAKSFVAALIAAGLACAQTTSLQTQPTPPAGGIQGPVQLHEGQRASLEFTWVESGTPTTLTGRAVSRNAWLFVEPAAEEAQVGLSGALSGTTSGPPQKLGAVDASALNLRTGPGTSHSVARRAERGEELVVVGSEGDWLKLDDGGRTLYAHKTYVDAIGGFAPGRRSISLRRSGQRYQAVVRRGREILATQVLRDGVPTVLLIATEAGNTFEPSLVPLETYYEARGYRVRRLVEPTHAGLVRLLREASTAIPYSRVVISTHSGWDGPLWDDGQVSLPEAEFTALAHAFEQGTTSDAKIYISGCHAGGSNRYESYRSDVIWVRDLARLSHRVVAGPTGSTSASQHTYRQTLATLEGEGSVVQETILATPTTVTRWGSGVKRTSWPNEAVAPEPASTYAPLPTTPEELFQPVTLDTTELVRDMELTPALPPIELDLQITPPTLPALGQD
ncbi:MAG: SH3 domain-containing protein [Planctomycetota bacterium]